MTPKTPQHSPVENSADQSLLPSTTPTNSIPTPLPLNLNNDKVIMTLLYFFYPYITRHRHQTKATTRREDAEEYIVKPDALPGPSGVRRRRGPQGASPVSIE